MYIFMWFGTSTETKGKGIFSCGLVQAQKGKRYIFMWSGTCTETKRKGIFSCGAIQTQKPSTDTEGKVHMHSCGVVQAQKLREMVHVHVLWYKHRN